MKRWIALAALLVPVGTSLAEDKPSLLIYQNPQEYTHEVRLGLLPYYSRWVVKGPAVRAAAQQALADSFASIGICDGGSTADVLVWLRASISYNPMPSLYYTQVTAQFHLGNGKYLGTLKGEGQQSGPLLSLYADDLVRKAFDAAMRDVAAQYAAHTTMQQAVADALASDGTKAPCAIIGAVPNP